MYLSAYAMFNHFFFLFLFLFLVFSYLDSDQSIQHQLHVCTNCQKHMPRPRIQWTFHRKIIFICCYKMDKICFRIKNQAEIYFQSLYFQVILILVPTFYFYHFQSLSLKTLLVLIPVVTSETEIAQLTNDMHYWPDVAIKIIIKMSRQHLN